MSNPRKKLKFGLGMAVGILLIIYALFQSKNLLQGPIITITGPKNGATLTEKIVKVTGSARNIAYINLNDHQIFVDENGNFSETLIAPYGYSVIKLSARDKFGETEEKTIMVNYPEDGPLLSDIWPSETGDIPEKAEEMGEDNSL